MKRALFAAIAAFAFVPNEGRAQAIVNDPLHMLLQEKSWLVQAQQMATTINDGVRRYNQLLRTYNAIAHSTDLGGVASALGGVSRTYMPEAAGTLDMVGRGARMFRNARGIVDADRFYSATVRAGAFARQSEQWLAEMERRENVTGNAKALAQAGMEDAQERIVQLEAAKARLEAAQDGTEVAAVQGLIQTAQANMALHDQQVRHMQFILAAEERTERQRAEQAQKESTGAMIEDTQWAVDALGGGSFGSGQDAIASAGPAGW